MIRTHQTRLAGRGGVPHGIVVDDFTEPAGLRTLFVNGSGDAGASPRHTGA